MGAIEIDMRARTPEPVGAFRLECERSGFGEQLTRAGLDLLAERVFGRASGAVTGLRAVPADQAQANPFDPAFTKALQLERVPVDCHHVPDRRTDTARPRRFAEIVRLRREAGSAASGEHEQEGREKTAHSST